MFFITNYKQEEIVNRLKVDLENKDWDNKFRHFRYKIFLLVRYVNTIDTLRIIKVRLYENNNFRRLSEHH